MIELFHSPIEVRVTKPDLKRMARYAYGEKVWVGYTQRSTGSRPYLAYVCDPGGDMLVEVSGHTAPAAAFNLLNHLNAVLVFGHFKTLGFNVAALEALRQRMGLAEVAKKKRSR